MEQKYAFPDGRIAVVFMHSIEPARLPAREFVRWEDLAGKVTGYGKVEHVEYRPSMNEQLLAMRAAAPVVL